MQESFNVTSSTGAYNVTAGLGLLEDLSVKYNDAIYVVDERLVQMLPQSITKKILISANESSKSLEAIPDIVLKMREAGANRSTHLVAIGGGVVQDIATFVASIYMRGITWTYMPTTLLGMADSCIGGKSSINTKGYKNLIGNFYPPIEVVIDINFVKTLNQDQVVGGLFEAAKICYARGYEYFLDYIAEEPVFPLGADKAQAIVVRSLKTKKWFIETDEFDKKERLLLNFGHTFGHALEAGTAFGISHGVAVGVGMVIAVEYAKILGVLSHIGQGRADHLIQHVKQMLGPGLVNVMRSPPDIDLALVLEKFNNDKKHRTSHYRMVLPTQDGELELVSVEKSDATLACIAESYRAGLSSLSYSNYK